MIRTVLTVLVLIARAMGEKVSLLLGIGIVPIG